MNRTGSRESKLIVIRGNSASGKTTAAHEIRRLHGRGVTIVSQDVLRRDILQVRDEPGNPAINLIDLTARYALNQGYHVVVEGILYGQIYAGMLTALVHDFGGRSACFYYDLSFEDTVHRHAGKPSAVEYGPELMQTWYRQRDVIPALNETVFGPDIALEDAVRTMMEAVNLPAHTEKE